MSQDWNKLKESGWDGEGTVSDKQVPTEAPLTSVTVKLRSSTYRRGVLET